MASKVKAALGRPFKVFAAYVLKKELTHAARALQGQALQIKQLYTEVEQLEEYRTRRQELADWIRYEVDTKLTIPKWRQQPSVQFIIDYFIQGPMGPDANTNGVHPADRWNIQDFPRRNK